MPAPPIEPTPPGRRDGRPKIHDPMMSPREMELTLTAMRRVAMPFEMTDEGWKFGRFMAPVVAGRGRRRRILYLDTRKDELVAEVRWLMGCTGYQVEERYYRHSDDEGKGHFYKIDPKADRTIPFGLAAEVHRHLQGVDGNVSNDGAVKEALVKAMAGQCSNAITAAMFGVRVMSRKTVLRDFDSLEDGHAIYIFDDGLEDNYYPRPVNRGFGGLPPPGLVEMQEEERFRYWNRISNRKPIPPDVWKFLEDTRSGRWLKEYGRKHGVYVGYDADDPEPASEPREITPL